MKRSFHLWKPLAAAAVFILVVLFTFQIRGVEGFANPFEQFFKMLQQQQQERTRPLSYDQWVGYLYTHVDDSGKALNDFRNRMFSGGDTCPFRRDWSTNLPRFMRKPQGTNDPQVANAQYKAFLDCLAEGNKGCLDRIADFQKRFFERPCRLTSNPIEWSNAGFEPVFKVGN